MAGKRGKERGDAEPLAKTDFAKTELPKPRERWTEENLPTLPPDVRYELIDEVGRGGMGKVMRAYDRRLDRPIAIKSLLGSREHVTRFLHEARITARLEHPGIVPVHDAGRLPGGEPFYAMKLVGGRTLEDALHVAGGLPGRLALLGVIIDVAYAIAYAHSQGVLHRDLKPGNVLVGEFGETLVIDWGLSKEIGRDAKPSDRGLRRISEPADETVEGSVMGTPAFLPPEQARGEPLDYRADVYAIGTLLYTLLTGQPPHEGRSKVEVLAAARSKRPRAIAELAPGAPPDLVAICDRAMAFDREARYASALELAEDLKRFQTGRLVAARSYGVRQLAMHWVRRHYTAVVLTLLSAIVVATIGIISVVRIVNARRAAVTERNRAQTQERAAQERAAQLMLTEARAQLAQDPTAALVGLKQLVASPAADAVPIEDIRMIAADAVSRGVIRHVMRGHTGEVKVLACTRDGQRAYTYAVDGELRVWDVAAGRALGVADEVAGRVHAFVLEDDGVLATGEDDGVVLRDRDAHVVRRLSAGAAMKAVALAGERVYGGGADGHLRSWQRSGAEPADVEIGAPIRALAVAPDGRVAVGTTTGRLAVWNPGASGALATADIGDSAALLRFDPDGHVIVASDHGFWDWDPTQRKARQILGVDSSSAYAVEISPDHRWLALANGRAGVIIDRAAPTAAPASYPISDGMAFSPSGRLVAITQREGLVLRNLVTGVDRKLGLFRNGNGVTFADERHVIVGGVDGEVFVLDIEGLVATDAWVVGSPARAVRLSADAKTILTFTFDRKIHELDVATRADVPRTMPSKISTFELTQTPHQVLMTSDGALYLVDLANDTRKPLVENEGLMYCLAVRGDRVAYQDGERTIHVRELATARETTFPQRDVMVSCAIAPDGTILLGTDFTVIRKVDPATGTVIAQDASHRGVITQIAALADGVVTASTDGTVRLWRGGKSSVLARHDLPVWGLSTWSDRLVASSGSDRSVRISDLDGHIVRVFRGHDDDVSGVAFAPDGGWVVSSSLDGSVRRWTIGSDSPPHTLREFATWLDAHTSVRPPD